MKILGIDPGTTRIGYGLIEKNGGVRLISSGLIDGGKVPRDQRLVLLEGELTKLLKRFRPDLVSLEKLFFTKNKRTAMSVSEARGVITLTIQKLNIPLLEFTPSDIKAVVAGNGRADKEEVKRAVCYTLGIESILGPDDVSDALAVALRGSFEHTLDCA
ncbi:MAG: crossover junction endodeoxyribonuclease RuvC [Candidatus Colwellbacteria bacterium]|nr:crossover junction endodeoxyribonuclease RuvC [Candidatus Colwellbacteria bacterium]